MSDLRYFEDSDSDWLYASLGALAIDGLLRIRSPATSESRWEWLDPSSSAWDTAHQRIYRNFRVDSLEAAQIEMLPPLPDKPPPDRPLKVDPVFESANYPALTEMLRMAASAALELYVILSEDTYESFCGDGKFHDFSAIRFTEAAAREYVDAAPSYCEAYYHRHLRVWLDGELIRYDLQKEVFDCGKIDEMLNEAEKLAASNREAGINASGTACRR